VIVTHGSARLIRRRETYADLLRYDVIDTYSSAQADGRLSAKKGSL